MSVGQNHSIRNCETGFSLKPKPVLALVALVVMFCSGVSAVLFTMLNAVLGELQSVPEVLPVHDVCTCVHHAGAANTTVPTAVHASTPWM